MNILAWIIVGLISGLLASRVVGGTGYGLVGDTVIGIVGAFVGGWIFSETGWHAPFSGIAGTIVIAFVGAVLALVALRLVRGGSRAR